MKSLVATAATLSACALLAACAGGMSSPSSAGMAMPFNQDMLPDAVKVPPGHRVAMETVGVGEITYECRAKAGAASTFEWAFVGPMAMLNDRKGSQVGTYFGPPATWASSDGSRITATQLAVAPGGAGNLPLQLVKANPAMGNGAMTGVTHVQRVATQGGVAPASPCDASAAGRKEIVKYQADYIFWKPA